MYIACCPLPVDCLLGDWFTPSYKLILPDGTRSYRVDILDASIDQQECIYVNGDDRQ